MGLSLRSLGVSPKRDGLDLGFCSLDFAPFWGPHMIIYFYILYNCHCHYYD